MKPVTADLASIAHRPAEIPEAAKHYENLLGLTKLRPFPSPTEAKKDSRSEYQAYTLGDRPPRPLIELMKLAKAQIGHINPTGVVIHFAVGMRIAGLEIPPPNSLTVHRFLMNFGDQEVYYLDPKVSGTSMLVKESLDDKLGQKKTSKVVDRDSGLPERKVVMGAGTVLNLGPSVTSNYLIKVSANPMRHFPSVMTSTRANKAPSTRAVPRRASYHRISVVVDFLGSEQQIQSIIETSRAIIKSTPVDKIPELLAPKLVPVAPTPSSSTSAPKSKVQDDETAELDKIIAANESGSGPTNSGI